MRDEDWKTLVDAIGRGLCTPFLGAGASDPPIPAGGDLSHGLAKDWNYPLKDVHNLPRVAQFIGTTHRDFDFPKRQVADLILGYEKTPPDFSDAGQAHRVLADLRLPMYLTTNYDRFMTQALKSVGTNGVTTHVCRWNFETRFKEPPIEALPSPDAPLVFHLHGTADKTWSMLLTEDDYIDFVMEAQADKGQPAMDSMIPTPVLLALTTTSLLFVGYSMNDWNFRILLRSLMRKFNGSQRFSMSVQLEPSGVSRDKRDRAEAFLSDYLGKQQVTVHWGRADEFLQQLRTKVEEARELGRV